MLFPKRFAILILSLCFIGSSTVVTLWAQNDRGTITGTVTDPSGGVLVGAEVTATNSGTAVSTKTTSGATGSFTIPLLRVGEYQVTAEHPGFKKFVQSKVTVNIALTTRVDIHLEVGEVSQSVEVTAEAVQVQSDTSDRGVLISGNEVANLPLVGVQEVRNPAFFVELAPGVSSRGTAYGTASGGGRQLNTTVNGSMSGSIEWHLEGAVIGQGTGLSGSFQVLPFPPDVVGEYKIMTLLPPAEYGQTGLGISNFTLRSGTNGFHGQVYEYFRNEALDARGFYSATTPLNKQNEFGGTIGGPIHKDQTFFYGWYTGFRNVKQPGNNVADTLPTAAMKSGDLSNILGGNIGTDALGRPVYASEIYDPATTRVVLAGAKDAASGLVNNSGAPAIMRDGFGFNPVTGLPIPGQANIIPSNRIDPVAKKMFAQFVDPPSCPSCNFGYQLNWFGGGFSNRDTINDFGLKIDHALSDRDRISASYMWKHELNPTSSKWPGAISEGSDAKNGWQIFRFSQDFFFKPSVINHWTFGFNRRRNDTFPQAGLGWPQQLGYNGVPQTGPGSTFPEMDIGGLGNTYARQSQGYGAENSFSFDDGLTWIKGRHTFKAGFSYIKLQNNSFSSLNQSSYNTYASGTTGLLDTRFYQNDSCSPGSPCTGVGVAGFLLGLPTSGSATLTGAPVADRVGRYSGYFQDDFKLSSKLTLNLGLRYDYFRPAVDAHNQKSWFDPLIMNTDLGIPGVIEYASDSRRSPLREAQHGWGPRFGFAYSFTPKTVIRGGYGILYTPAGGARSNAGGYGGLQFGWSAFNSCGTSGFAGFIGSLSCSPTTNNDVHMTLATGWPAQYFQPVPIVDQNLFNGAGPATNGAWPGDERAPQIQNGYFSIQRELPGKILLDIGYVWTKGTNLSSRLQESNVVDTKYMGFGADLFKDIADPAIQALPVVQAMPVDSTTGMHSPFNGFQALWGGNAQLGQALRPFPQYRNGTIHPAGQQMENFGETKGMSTYNALQFSARKNLSNGLSFLVSYTWSKTLTNAGSLGNEFTGFAQDYYNTRGEKGLSINDYPSNLALSYLYELPFGAGKKFVNKGGAANKVIGGWSIAGVQHYRHGAPQAIVGGGNSLWPYMSATSFMARANVVPGVEKKSAAILNGTWDPNAPGAAGSRFNFDAWTPAAPYTFGYAPQLDGNVRDFPFYQEDISIIKRTNITERVSIEFRADFLNAFNRVLFGFDQGGDQYGQMIQNGNLGGGPGAFGRVSGQTNPPREIQFGLKINY